MLVVVAVFMELMLVVSCCDLCAHDRGAFIPYDTNNSSRKTNLTQLSQMTHFLVMFWWQMQRSTGFGVYGILL
jgi:hypothetical protein